MLDRNSGTMTALGLSTVLTLTLVMHYPSECRAANESKTASTATNADGKTETATDGKDDGAPRIDIPELPDVKIDVPVSGVGSSSTDSLKGGASSGTSPEAAAGSTPEATAKEATPGTRPKPPGFDAAKKLFDQKKYNQAQKAFEKFVASGAADVNTHAYLAVCFFKQHVYSRAQAENEWVAKYATGEGLKRSASNTAAALRAARSGTCPGNCLGINDPRWRYLPDRSRDKKWISFSHGNATSSWSQNHIGEVIRYINGVPTNMGTCPKCGGAGYVVPLKDGMASPW